MPPLQPPLRPLRLYIRPCGLRRAAGLTAYSSRSWQAQHAAAHPRPRPPSNRPCRQRPRATPLGDAAGDDARAIRRLLPGLLPSGRREAKSPTIVRVRFNPCNLALTECACVQVSVPLAKRHCVICVSFFCTEVTCTPPPSCASIANQCPAADLVIAFTRCLRRFVLVSSSGPIEPLIPLFHRLLKL